VAYSSDLPVDWVSHTHAGVYVSS